MTEEIKYNNRPWKQNLLISIATLGWVRYEWAAARYAQIIPINWGSAGFDIGYTALNYGIDDAYNLIVQKAIETGVEWLLIIEDDVVLPIDCFLKMSQHMDAKKEPVVSGLYYTKANPSEPLLFRGRGNGAFLDWHRGDKVYVDGLPMGCLLIHTSLLKSVADESEYYRLPTGETVKKVFETPRRAWVDPETGVYHRQEGTQDLFFFDRVINNDHLKKAGWDEVANRKYPFLCDTSIFCKHIDRNSGRMFP